MPDHAFHRDEEVRIGKSVHASWQGYCIAATITGHYGAEPDEEMGWVYLNLHYPPVPPMGQSFAEPWSKRDPDDRRDKDYTWHWGRACPHNR